MRARARAGCGKRTPPEDGEVLSESVSVLGEKVPLDAVHEIFEALGHSALFITRLAADYLLPQFVEVFLIQKDQS